MMLLLPTFLMLTIMNSAIAKYFFAYNN